MPCGHSEPLPVVRANVIEGATTQVPGNQDARHTPQSIRQILARAASGADEYTFSLMLQKRWSDAEAELRRAAKLSPGYERVHMNLAIVMVKQRRYDDAFEQFQIVLGEAIAHFGTSEVAELFLPGYCAGTRIGAMVLTEPGVGSDLQRVRVRAIQDDDGTWRLRGTKQFISNGNGQTLLVLVR